MSPAHDEEELPMPPNKVPDQQAVIHSVDFLTEVRAKLQAANQVLAKNQIQADGGLVVDVNGVKVRMEAAQPGDQDVQLAVGEANSGHPLYEWRWPLSWVS